MQKDKVALGIVLKTVCCSVLKENNSFSDYLPLAYDMGSVVDKF